LVTYSASDKKSCASKSSMSPSPPLTACSASVAPPTATSPGSASSSDATPRATLSRCPRRAYTDLGSSNGSFVRLRDEHQVASGDILLMGQQLFRIDA
jgi:hypothetical protein